MNVMWQTACMMVGKFTIFKLKNSHLSYILKATKPSEITKWKSRNGASVSDEFALLIEILMGIWLIMPSK